MASASQAGFNGQPNWLRLLRYSHIFSAVVREVLEQDPLIAAAGRDMTPRQFHLLEFISGAPHNIDDVARFLGVTPPAATRAVDKLERRGLILRSGCDADRRVTLVACSDSGRALVRRYRQLQEETIASALGALGTSELEDLALLLEHSSVALAGADTRGASVCLRCSGLYDSECPLQRSQRGCAYQRGWDNES